LKRSPGLQARASEASPLKPKMNRFVLLLASLLASGASLFAQADATSRSGNQPVEPYRIAGNIYYVGASDVTSYLIATPEGHILLDGGFVETAPIIEANVRKLGFKLEDVKVLLSSHAHFDHAGGLAELKRATGAKFFAAEREAPVLARGGKGDFYFADRDPFPPIQTDHTLRDGDSVTLGGTTLIAHLTPGHTMGNTTWTMKAKEGERTLDVVFVGSTSILPGISLTKNAAYPEIAADYARTFRVLRALPCDVFLGSHASFFDGLAKAERLRTRTKENPFVDPQGYREYVARNERTFAEQMRREGGDL
jgi:metallo-beta-lactamase class B